MVGRGITIVATLSLVACTSPPTVTPEAGAEPTVDPNAETMTVEVLNTELAVGRERIAFRITDDEGSAVAQGAEVDTAFYRLLPDSGEAARAASGPAAYFGAGLPNGGSWVVYSPFDSSGEWGMEITARRPDGWSGHARFNVQVAAHPSTPREGEDPPFGDSPTAAPGTDLAAISGDPDPDPDLYAMSIAQAAASGRPTVIHFGSPGHCPNGICSASLKELKSVRSRFSDRVNFIHVETRDMADPSQPSVTAKAWGLPSEPWTFVLRKSGRVAWRMEGGLDAVELRLLLERELGAPGG